MLIASTPSRRAAAAEYLSAPEALPEPGSCADIRQILRTLSPDEIGAGIAFMLCIGVAFLALVVFG